METTTADYVWKLLNRLRLATNFAEISLCLQTEVHWTKTFDQKSESIRKRREEITEMFLLFSIAGVMIYKRCLI
jgi:hypothetical protein